jgi:glycopeptide antibiotics resistance protein
LALVPVAEAYGIVTPLYRVFLLVIICLTFYFCSMLNKQRTSSSKLLKKLFWLYFALYLYLLLGVTLMDVTLGRGSLWQSGQEDLRKYYMERHVNLVPLRTILQTYVQGLFKGYVGVYYTVLNLFGNLCAFMPMAFFLPHLFKARRRWFVLFPTVLLSICAVELLQLFFMIGSCDVDDVILNFWGFSILFGILRRESVKRLLEKFTTGEWT